MRKKRTQPANLNELDPAEKRRLFSRRRFLRGLAAVGALAIGQEFNERTHIRVSRQTIFVRRLPAPMRLAQLSDLHRSWCVEESFIARIVEETNALQPDVVALTGDFVTISSEYAASCVQQLSRLRARLGLYGVLGNHDYWCDSRKGGPAVAEALTSVSVQMLTNRNLRLDNGLFLVGVDDCWAGRPDPEAAFRGVPAGAPAVTLTHNPNLFRDLCVYDCVTLAGHTHGGQIDLPFVTQIYLGRHNRYKAGWYGEPNRPGRLYVSRGLGVVGIPVRIRATPEIAVFDLLPA
ncbi:MAG TPA: metallophosphoesterase [Chthonomonadaceae bacterium]|nr:metallophosphoesterase [Chthonomonadaceae bacterium]